MYGQNKCKTYYICISEFELNIGDFIYYLFYSIHIYRYLAVFLSIFYNIRYTVLHALYGINTFYNTATLARRDNERFSMIHRDDSQKVWKYWKTDFTQITLRNDVTFVKCVFLCYFIVGGI